MEERVQVYFGKWLGEGFALYKANLGMLVLAMLGVCALSLISLGLLIPPLIAGITMITLRLADGQEPYPTAGDIFDGFKYFVSAFLFMLIWGIIILAGSLMLAPVPVLGQVVSLFFSYALQALLIFGMFLIVDQKMGFWAASTVSMNIVKTNFWPFLGFSMVTSLIGGIGALAMLIGIIFTMPIQICMVTVAYRDVFAPQSSNTEELDYL